jgi:hypothetical protein
VFWGGGSPEKEACPFYCILSITGCSRTDACLNAGKREGRNEFYGLQKPGHGSGVGHLLQTVGKNQWASADGRNEKEIGNCQNHNLVKPCVRFLDSKDEVLHDRALW